MSSSEKSKEERLRSAAIVKLKYRMVAGKIDNGFQTIYHGVLEDLSVREEEVDRYLEENQKELERVCLGGSPGRG